MHHARFCAVLEEPEIVRSPMQERLAQTLDEAISVASEATSVNTFGRSIDGHCVIDSPADGL